jgi:hypothetical protein
MQVMQVVEVATNEFTFETMLGGSEWITIAADPTR